MSATFEDWISGIVFSMLFVILFVIVVVNMNLKYGENYSVEGLDTSILQSRFEEMQSGLGSKLENGTADTSASDGISFSNSWSMILSSFSFIRYFLTGSWIMTITSYLKLPSVVGSVLMGLYYITIIFIIMRIIFKR